jgi:hypothetical protein
VVTQRSVELFDQVGCVAQDVNVYLVPVCYTDHL